MIRFSLRVDVGCMTGKLYSNREMGTVASAAYGIVSGTFGKTTDLPVPAGK